MKQLAVSIATFGLAACQTVAPSLAANGGSVAGAKCGVLEAKVAAPANAVEPKSGRQFYLEYPCDLKAGEQVTLVLSLHGAGSSGSWQRLYFPAGDYAKDYRLIVATPTAASSAPLSSSGASVRMWVEANDDQHLRDISDLLIASFGKSNIKSFWLIGHSQGGLTSNRIVCSDYFAARVDGFTSLAGGRVGSRGAAPACDYSHIFETGSLDTAGVAGIPATSPLADRYQCQPKARKDDVVDTDGGKVHDPRALGPTPPRAGWGGAPGPGTATVEIYPNCADGRVVADIVRLNKGHTEGLEPKVTETIVRMMTTAPGGKVQNAAL